MAKKFDLFAQLTPKDSPVSNSNTKVVDIRLDAIDDNAGNFYTVDNVDDLAESIQLVGLQQPLVVRRDGERFTLIAGHRRRKALTQLGRETAPCIITGDADGSTDDAFAALRLIMTNSTARELSYSERMEQVRQVETELIKLSEQGVKLPGKMRDRVAELTMESAAEVARMKAIENRLSKDWKKLLKQKKISASAAYEISRIEERAQKRLLSAFRDKLHKLDAKTVKAAGAVYVYDWVPDICPESPEWRTDLCSRVTERAAYREKHPDCPGCCSKCEQAEDCPLCCGAVTKKRKAQSEAEQRKLESEKADTAFEQSTFAKIHRRCIEVLTDFGITDMAGLKEVSGLEYWQLGGALQCNRHITKLSLETYCKIADALGITLAQLLGLEVVPSAQPIKWRGIGWDDPPRDMDIIAMFRTRHSTPHLRQARYEHGEYLMLLDVDGESIPLPSTFTHWAPLPEDEDA